MISTVFFESLMEDQIGVYVVRIHTFSDLLDSFSSILLLLLLLLLEFLKGVYVVCITAEFVKLISSTR